MKVTGSTGTFEIVAFQLGSLNFLLGPSRSV
jgi:hypothetical protein